MTEINKATSRQIEAFINRIETLEQEKAEVSEDIRQVYLEAKACGFDVPALRRIVVLRRKDPNALKEAQAIEDTYINALGSLVGSPLGEWARAHMKMESQARLNAAVATHQTVVDAIGEVIQGEFQKGTRAADGESTVSVNGGPEIPLSAFERAVGERLKEAAE